MCSVSLVYTVIPDQCANALPWFETKSCLFPAVTSKILRNLKCIFFGCFKTKKIVCILVISVMSIIFKCLKSRYSCPYFSELTFQDIEDFNMYTMFLFWVISNFFKCQKPHYSHHGLPVNSHANFTYLFPTLKIILIPTMTRSNHFWFINLTAHTGPPMPESQFLYVT